MGQFLQIKVTLGGPTSWFREWIVRSDGYAVKENKPVCKDCVRIILPEIMQILQETYSWIPFTSNINATLLSKLSLQRVILCHQSVIIKLKNN